MHASTHCDTAVFFLHRDAIVRCLSVCLSVTFVYCVETNILKLFIVW